MIKKKYRYQKDNQKVENLSLYIFATVLFVMGVIFGSLMIKSLSIGKEQELLNYISDFFYNISISDFDSSESSFRLVLLDNLKFLFFIWFLGLSIIGMPLIFLIIYMKGFVIGFTISFFISELSWKGFIFSLISIIPQNLLIVPALIIAGVAGTLFSLSLIKGRIKSSKYSYQQSFISYSLLILFLGLIIVIASAFETFISPYLMKEVTTFLIKS